MAMTSHYHSNHYDPYANKPKTNDIFEQTIIIDKPLSQSFYDCLKEVTLDAEIVIGRVGVVEEIVPLEQWESVIGETYEATQEEEWIIEPEETIYTVVKWEGVEGGEKHVIENRQWKEVAHTPPIHTKQHVSPLVEFEGNQDQSIFSFGNENHFVRVQKTEELENTHTTHQSSNKSEAIFQKPHVSEATETIWNISRQESTSANHAANYTNGYTTTTSPKSSDDPLGAWHKIEHPIENGESVKSESNLSTPESKTQQHGIVWRKTHVNEPSNHHVLNKNSEMPHSSPTQIPKPKNFTYTSSYESRMSTPESTKRLSSPIGNGTSRTPSPKPFPRANTLSGTAAPLPSPPVEKHIYIAAKPASHFISSYAVKSASVDSDPAKSPSSSNTSQQKYTWRRTHGNQYVREPVAINQK